MDRYRVRSGGAAQPAGEVKPVDAVETARLLFDLVADISRELDIRFELVNLGGGFGIRHHLDDH